MTLHASDNVITHNAKQTAKKKSRKYTVVAAGLGVVLAGGGAALAAMLITGDGSASAQAYKGQKLTISNETFSKPIYPGVNADLSFKVVNPNPFQVTVQSVAIDSTRTVSISCDSPGDEAKLTGPAMSTTGSYNIPAASQVSVPASDNRTITIPNAVHLDASATGGCSLTIPFKVTGAGSGN